MSLVALDLDNCEDYEITDWEGKQYVRFKFDGDWYTFSGEQIKLDEQTIREMIDSE